jgi:hypothetical protein
MDIKMKRTITGPVAGGTETKLFSSSPLEPRNLESHAKGRVVATTDLLIQSVYLKHASGGNFVSGVTGAKFQDFPGTRLQVAAHRAFFAPQMDGRNIADLPMALQNLQLRSALKAPQAQTDMMFPVDNYADRIWEIVGTTPILQIFKQTVDQQKKGAPFEINLVLDASCRLRAAITDACDQAAQRCEDIWQGKGNRIVDLKDFLHHGGPSSEIVDDNLTFTLEQGGPSTFADRPIIYLGTSQDVISHTLPPMNVLTIESAVAKLDDAAGSSVQGGGGDNQDGG